MEEIKIKEINKKDSGLVIVKYVICEYVGMPDAEATLNTKWQSQEVDYLEKDVGIGGKVKVTIVQKDKYTNITKVDFDSAKKNDTTITESEKIVETPAKVEGAYTTDDRIAASVILKGAIDLTKGRGFGAKDEIGEYLTMCVDELTGAYKLALSNVKNL